jgi:hypothetical protein
MVTCSPHRRKLLLLRIISSVAAAEAQPRRSSGSRRHQWYREMSGRGGFVSEKVLGHPLVHHNVVLERAGCHQPCRIFKSKIKMNFSFSL